MTRPLVSFVAILKNEAANIRRTLESVRPFVDRWTVLDTGSTDGTQGIVLEVMRGVPGLLYEEPFVDFATSRNRALELDAVGSPGSPAAEFTLMLSGDETLQRGDEMRAFLEASRRTTDGAFAVEMATEQQTWLYPRILRTTGGWRYVGVVHELPVAPDGTTTCVASPARVVNLVSDPERRAARVREFDLPALQKIVDDASRPLPERARAIYFLAQSHAVVASQCDRAEVGGPWLSHMLAAMALYWRFAQLAEASESQVHDRAKAHYAYFYYLHVAEKAGLFSYSELLPRVEALAEAAPGLPEVHFMRAICAANVDVRMGAHLAEHAATVARRARANPTHLPTDGRIEWMSFKLAWQCARQLGSPRAAEFHEKAIQAGAPLKEVDG